MRNSYILLRNNIESSSLHIEDLEQIGLLETDLIWVECQSVCWQTPKEIPELKKILPANQSIDKSNTSVVHSPQEENKNKLIYVELPAEEKIIKQKDTGRQKEPLSGDINQYGNPGTVKSPLPTKKNISLKTSDKPFSEFNDPLIQSTDKKKNLQQTIFGFELPENAKKITLYIGLVVVGALFMLLVMSSDNKNKIVLQPLPQQPEKAIAISEPLESEENNTSLPEIFEEQPIPEIENPETIKKVTPQLPISTTNASGNKTKDIVEHPIPAPEMSSKKIQPFNEPRAEKKVPIENISSKLTLKANDYNMGSFGGIKNLEVTLENGSSYLLDKIAVEINYLNPEGNTVNTDKIYFQSIGPGDVATLPVKKSKRGVKIELKVINIESREISDVSSTAAGLDNYSKN